MCFEYRQLRYALAAAEHGSFRAGGAALDIEPSALSRQVGKMERQLGTKLFERSRDGVRPTQAGERFLRTARRVRDHMEGLTRANIEVAARDVARLGIGFNTSLSAGPLRADLVEFARLWPTARIDPLEGSRSRLTRALERGLVDVAFMSGRHRLDGFQRMPVWSERLYAALRDRHPLAGKAQMTWTDLGGERVLVSSRDPGTDIAALLRNRLFYAVHQPQLMTFDVSTDALAALGQADFGVALLHEACLGVRRDGQVYCELVDDGGPSRIDFSAYWSADNDNPLLRAFLDRLETRHPRS